MRSVYTYKFEIRKKLWLPTSSVGVTHELYKIGRQTLYGFHINNNKSVFLVTD